MKSIDPENLTSGFVEAIRVFGQYLTGNRDWGWGTAAARYLFQMEGLGAPSEPPTEDEAFALASYGTYIDRLKSDPNLRLPKGVKTAEAYMNRAFNSTFLNPSANSHINNYASIADVINEITTGNLSGGGNVSLDLQSPSNLTISQDSQYWDANTTSNWDPNNVPSVRDIGKEYYAPLPPETDLETTYGTLADFERDMIQIRKALK